MDLSPDDSSTWLKGVIALLLGAWVWSVNRLVRQLDGQKNEIDLLKDAVASKASLADIASIYTRITLIDERLGNRLTALADRSNEQHVEVLEAVNQKHEEILMAVYNRNSQPPPATR